ncbi:hypothetical protein B0E51_13250 [Rhodanobacter sp. C05]|nr:hypothetical protein B0E51_13250 [Rhodanobacter sp. C05]
MFATFSSFYLSEQAYRLSQRIDARETASRNAVDEVIASNRLPEFNAAEISLTQRRLLFAEGLAKSDLEKAMSSVELHLSFDKLVIPTFAITLDEIQTISKGDPKTAAAVVKCTSDVKEMDTIASQSMDTFNQGNSSLSRDEIIATLSALKSVYTTTDHDCVLASDALNTLANPEGPPLRHVYEHDMSLLIADLAKHEISLNWSVPDAPGSPVRKTL